MEERNALGAVLFISLIGLLFSGYLTYMEVFKNVCIFGPETCFKFFSLPISFYEFAIFLILFLISMFGLKHPEI